MFQFNIFVPANEIWPTARNHQDMGSVVGLLRGYNIEVKTSDGKLEWLSCEYISHTPEKHFNDDFHTWMYKEHMWVPTGRICFRGYGLEEWSDEDREMMISPCDYEGNILPFM